MFIKTTFNSDLNHILNCVNKCDFGTKCFAKVEHFVLRLIEVLQETSGIPKKQQKTILSTENNIDYHLCADLLIQIFHQ